MASENIRITLSNAPYGVIKIDASPKFIRAMSRYLMEKYRDRPEADITSPDFEGHLREFAGAYSDGVITFRTKKFRDTLGRDVSSYEINEIPDVSLN